LSRPDSMTLRMGEINTRLSHISTNIKGGIKH
jgi:hypothetical protein